MGSLSFADDKKVPALQAADLIASETSKIYTDVVNETFRTRMSFNEIATKIVGDWRLVRENELFGMAKTFGVQIKADETTQP